MRPAIRSCDAGGCTSEGLRGAVMIAADELQAGTPVSAVEVIVKDETGKQMLRSVLSLSVAPLALSDGEKS